MSLKAEDDLDDPEIEVDILDSSDVEVISDLQDDLKTDRSVWKMKKKIKKYLFSSSVQIFSWLLFRSSLLKIK